MEFATTCLNGKNTTVCFNACRLIDTTYPSVEDYAFEDIRLVRNIKFVKRPEGNLV